MSQALSIFLASATVAVLLAQDGALPGGDILPIPTEGHSLPPISGEALIAEGLDRLPLEPLVMTGRIIMRGPKGIISKQFRFDVFVEWGAEPPIAVYKIFDMKGNLLETVTAKAGNALSLTPPSLTRVLPGSDAESSPPWNERVQDTDVTWLDVTLGFLWWQNPTLVGKTEKVKGRLCDIVDLFPPIPVPNCAKARVWLDREVKLLMQAEEISPAGKTNRKLWVRAVKKIRDRWMVRDLEVETHGTKQRTRLHIEDVVEQEKADCE